jgi:nicotinic acid mononucleotide adenylyltransferase
VEIIGQVAHDVRSVALLPAAFHPPTRAHEAMLRAALAHCDAALAVLPRLMPHKQYGAVGLEQRLEMVRPMLGERMAAAVSDGGLFLEIAREAREQFPLASLSLVCGRDAAERIVAWPYREYPPIEEQLRDYSLLVAAREGEFAAPASLAHGIRRLALPAGLDAISSTRVRERMGAGEPWEHLVPPASLERVRDLYSPLLFSRNARSL